jgi:8-oxo-dGTP diphosphatase
VEICDVYDESGHRTGEQVARGTKLSSGEYYLVVHVWIRNEAGGYLIQQRGLHLISDPGVWATTVGYVLSDEESIDGAIREVMEELGLQLSSTQLRRFDQLKTPPRIEAIWIADVTSDTMDAPVIGKEVADWKWASKREMTRMIFEGHFFAYSYFDRLPE